MTDKLISRGRLRWLFAETLVIVLGILVALAVDDYRTDRLERQLAIDYIRRIQGDLARDLEYINRIFIERLAIKRESLEAIAPVIRKQVALPDDVEQFLRQVARGGVSGTSAMDWYTDTTFQDMRATGNLRLIQDVDIRAKISNYYESMQRMALRIEARRTGYAQFVHSVMPAELRDDIDMEALDAFGTDYALKRLLTNEFRDLLNQEYNLLLFMEGGQGREFTQSLIDELAGYLLSLEGE